VKIKPIFVDSTGRRRKLFTMIAAAAGVLLATSVVVLVAGFFGAGPSYLPGLPDLQPAQQEVARVPDGPPSSDPALPRPAPATTSPQNGNNPAPTVSTSDTRGNGNRPTHTPGHPQPSRTK
jgi:hypothetical protein